MQAVVAVNTGGGGGGSDTGGGGAGGGGNGGGGSGETSNLTVACPTLDNEFPAFFGAILENALEYVPCAMYFNLAAYVVTIKSISVPSPFILVSNCDTSSNSLVASFACESGTSLASGWRNGLFTGDTPSSRCGREGELHI